MIRSYKPLKNLWMDRLILSLLLSSIPTQISLSFYLFHVLYYRMKTCGNGNFLIQRLWSHLTCWRYINQIIIIIIIIINIQCNLAARNSEIIKVYI